MEKVFFYMTYLNACSIMLDICSLKCSFCFFYNGIKCNFNFYLIALNVDIKLNIKVTKD